MPSQDILYPSGTITINLTLKKKTLSLLPTDKYSNTLAKLKDITEKHLFVVQWAAIS